MTDRDRLIELLIKEQVGCYAISPTWLADYLIANGVILPPYKIGDTVYRIIAKSFVADYWHIAEIQINANEMIFIDNGGNYFIADDVGKKVFLTKEEAEAKLKECEGK